MEAIAIPRGLRAKSCLPAVHPAAGVVSLSSPKRVQASCHRVPSRKDRKGQAGKDSEGWLDQAAGQQEAGD